MKNNRYLKENDKDKQSAVVARKDVAQEQTWDLTPLFASDEAWEKSYSAAQSYIEEITSLKDGFAEDAASVLKYFELAEKHGREIYKLYSYASMRSDEDTAVSKYSGMRSQMGQFYAQYMAASSFAEPILANLEEEKFEEFYKEEAKLKQYERTFKKIQESRPHVLSQETEQVLAAASNVLDAGGSIFGVLDNADQKFPVIKDEEGQEVELTHARYSKFIESRDRRVRKDTFQALYKTYDQFKNTYAETLSMQVLSHNFTAQARKFSSARESALFANEIPEKVYDQLLETVHNNLPLLHRYVKVRKDLLGLEEMHTYDLYVPVVEDVELNYSIEDAKEILLNALKPLGEDYLLMIKKAFDERWIDYAENAGKRSGAYSGGCYDSPPYILMTWQGSLNNLYTLAHELGHSCHSYLSRANQEFIYAGYPIFLAEIASTVNENLLTKYLLETVEDKELKKYIVMNYLDGFKGTVFRQSQFADFELRIHQAAQEGTALTAEWLIDLYGKMNEEYYGPSLEKDPEIALEWARIPHFYYDFYVYQYATGFSAATAFVKNIEEKGQEAVDAYLGFLSSGCSRKPIETLQAAGVDMSSAKPVEDAMAKFAEFLDILEKDIA